MHVHLQSMHICNACTFAMNAQPFLFMQSCCTFAMNAQLLNICNACTFAMHAHLQCMHTCAIHAHLLHIWCHVSANDFLPCTHLRRACYISPMRCFITSFQMFPIRLIVLRSSVHASSLSTHRSIHGLSWTKCPAYIQWTYALKWLMVIETITANGLWWSRRSLQDLLLLDRRLCRSAWCPRGNQGRLICQSPQCKSRVRWILDRHVHHR